MGAGGGNEGGEAKKGEHCLKPHQVKQVSSRQSIQSQEDQLKSCCSQYQTFMRLDISTMKSSELCTSRWTE